MEKQEDLQALATGDIKEFERIFMQYQPRLIYFLKGFLHDEETSRDIAQDIFLYLWINRARLAEVRSFSSYLFQIARYNVYNYYDRLLIREKYTVEQMLQPRTANTVEEEIFLKELQAHIASLIEQMPEQRRRIFRMSRYERLSSQEIATQLNINKRTVENQISLALGDLRKVLYFICFFI